MIWAATMTNPPQSCIIVVNQSAAAGIEIMRALQQANYRVAGPFELCSDASDWLACDTADGALLDVLLTEDACYKLAKDLRQRGVPYLFHATPAEPNDGSATVGSVPSLDALLKAVSALIGKGPNRTAL
jgi:hypothetical protein